MDREGQRAGDSSAVGVPHALPTRWAVMSSQVKHSVPWLSLSSQVLQLVLQLEACVPQMLQGVLFLPAFLTGACRK